MKNRARETNELFDAPVDSDPRLRSSGVQARAARRVSSSPPAMAEAGDLPVISIGAPADPALLEPTYAYLSSYCFAVFPPPLAQRLNVAIYELYANALRYGTDRGEVRLELRRRGSSVQLRISNFAEPAQIARLKKHLTRVQDDPSAAFSGEMNRFDRHSEPPPMLGIVRIAHEVGMPLELRADEQRVEISTICDG